MSMGIEILQVEALEKGKCRVTFENGTSRIQTLSQSGVKIGSQIEIPAISNKAERQNVVRDLHQKGYTPDEIAAFCNVSQSTVHNDLKK